MKKKPHGYYCRICQQYKANEKFSGRGHANHICKVCAKHGNRPPETEPEPLVLVDEEDIGEYGFIYTGDIDSILFFADEEAPIPKKKKRKPSKEKLLRSAQKKKAKALLRELLANGEVSVKIIEQAASKAGIPHEALRRAKGSLKISSAGGEIGSGWRLPAHKKQAVSAKESMNGGNGYAIFYMLYKMLNLPKGKSLS